MELSTKDIRVDFNACRKLMQALKLHLSKLLTTLPGSDNIIVFAQRQLPGFKRLVIKTVAKATEWQVSFQWS